MSKPETLMLQIIDDTCLGIYDVIQNSIEKYSRSKCSPQDLCIAHTAALYRSLLAAHLIKGQLERTVPNDIQFLEIYCFKNADALLKLCEEVAKQISYSLESADPENNYIVQIIKKSKC